MGESSGMRNSLCWNNILNKVRLKQDITWIVNKKYDSPGNVADDKTIYVFSCPIFAFKKWAALPQWSPRESGNVTSIVTDHPKFE